MATNSTTPSDKVLLGCSKCGASLPDEAQFCLKCGKPVSSTAKSATVVETAPPVEIVRPRAKRHVALWFFLVVLAGLILWMALDGPGAQQVQELAGWKHDETILDAPFTVAPHSFRYYKFSLPEGSVNVSIVGQFASASDSHVVANKVKAKDKDNKEERDDSIEVSVLTEPAFTIWQNGYATSTVYVSGKVAQGAVQADIPAGAGIYYLVFSNKLAPKTPKNIHATVLLRYKSWLPEWFRRMKERAWNWLGM